MTKDQLLSSFWNTNKYYQVSNEFDQYFITTPWFDKLKSYSQNAKRVLDVGCGEGTILQHLCSSSNSIGTGIDISPLAIRLARQQYPQLQFETSDAENLPFTDNTFDFCYNVATLEHLSNPEIVISEMIRVTKVNGILAFWTSNFASPFMKPHIADYSNNYKLIKGILRSFYYLVNPPQSLNWDRAQPRIAPSSSFIPDDDLVIEPNIQTLILYLRKNKITILYDSTGWEYTLIHSPKKLVRLLTKIGLAVKIAQLAPFRYWGINLLVIARKTR